MISCPQCQSLLSGFRPKKCQFCASDIVYGNDSFPFWSTFLGLGLVLSLLLGTVLDNAHAGFWLGFVNAFAVALWLRFFSIRGGQ